MIESKQRQPPDDRTVIPAQPGFDVVELCHGPYELAYIPIVAWIITTSDDSEGRPCTIPVCIDWNSNSLDCNVMIRQPNGDIVYTGGATFRKGEEDKALAYLVQQEGIIE